MARIGIGLIGVGRHGLRYAHHIRQDVPDLELVAIARRNRKEAQRQAEEFGCRAYDDYRDLLAAPEVDAVALVVPPALHLEMIEEAARRGRPVLLEKPAAITVDEGRRMVQAVKNAGIPVMVAQTLRYNGVVQTLLREREKIGRIHAVRVSQRFEPSPVGWVDDLSQAGGGILLHTGVHGFDLIRLFSGLEADGVYCRMEKVGDVELENNFSAMIELGRGEVLATVSGCRATESRTGAMDLAGEKGQLLGDHVLGTAHLVRERTATALPVPEDVPTVRATLEDFARALLAEREMPIPLEEGLRASALALACHRSALEGVRVRVDRMWGD